MASQLSARPYASTCVQKVGAPLLFFIFFVPSSSRGRSRKRSRNIHHALPLHHIRPFDTRRTGTRRARLYRHASRAFFSAYWVFRGAEPTRGPVLPRWRPAAG